MPLRETRIYTLTIPSQASVDAPGGATAKLKYNVNWDAILRGDNRKYQTCRVRFHLVSNNTTAAAIGNSTGALILQGLSPQGGQVDKMGTTAIYNVGAVLGTITPTNSTASGAGTVGYFYDVSTIHSTTGVEVGMPFGYQTITVQFTGETFAATGDAYVSDYLLVLYFELRDPIE